MYAIPLTCHTVNVSSVKVGVSVAKILKVKSGDYLELTFKDGHVILMSNISYDDSPNQIKVNPETAKLLDLTEKVVKVSRCKYSRRKVFNKVKVNLTNCEKPSIMLLAHIKHSLVGKPARENYVIPINTPSGTIMVRILETEPSNINGLIGSSTIVEF